MLVGSCSSEFASANDAVNFVGHIAEATRLRAIAVNGQIFAASAPAS